MKTFYAIVLSDLNTLEQYASCISHYGIGRLKFPSPAFPDSHHSYPHPPRRPFNRPLLGQPDHRFVLSHGRTRPQVEPVNLRRAFEARPSRVGQPDASGSLRGPVGGAGIGVLHGGKLSQPLVCAR